MFLNYFIYGEVAILIDNVLIVSTSQRAIDFFSEMLMQNSYSNIVVTSNCSHARRLFIERSFELCIINCPLKDEFGVNFAIEISSRSITQIILVVKNELEDEISSKVEDYGIFVIGKPINRRVFWSVLKLANASYNKILQLKNENNELLEKINDIRLIDRAKCILIQYLKMTEAEAHRYIEKNAMDLRITKKQVAENILKTYEI